jgi:hypothetical protein
MAKDRAVTKARAVGHVLVTYTTAGALDEQTLGLAFVTLADPKITRHLAGVGGTVESTSHQRLQAGEIMKAKRDFKMVFLADSLIVRGIATALSWFNVSSKAFSSFKKEQALRWLDIPPSLDAEILATMNELTAEAEAAVGHQPKPMQGLR